MKQGIRSLIVPVAIVFTLAASVPLAAQKSPEAQKAESRQAIVLRAYRMLDVESGKIIKNAVVVIENGLIKSVGSKDIPKDAQTVDLGNRTLLPGLIDMHTHLCENLVGDWIHRPVKETAADMTLRGTRNARKTLLAGFTTVRDVDSRFFADVSLMRAVEAGFIEGPWVFPVGHALSITGGPSDITGFAPGILELGPKEGVADGVDEVIKAVRYQIKHGAKFIKVMATAQVMSSVGLSGAQHYSEEELRAIVEEAKRQGVKVAAHAHGTEGIIAAVRAGVASIEHGSMLNDEAIHLMKEKGTYLVPTVYGWYLLDDYDLPPVIQKKVEHVRSFVEASIRAAIRAGVKIAFGTDAGSCPDHGENAGEFATMVELGMSPLEAIRTATINAADLLGVEDRGVIAPGWLADLVAVPGNPLKDINVLKNVQFVMQGGRIIKRP